MAAARRAADLPRSSSARSVVTTADGNLVCRAAMVPVDVARTHSALHDAWRLPHAPTYAVAMIPPSMTCSARIAYRRDSVAGTLLAFQYRWRIQEAHHAKATARRCLRGSRVLGNAGRGADTAWPCKRLQFDWCSQFWPKMRAAAVWQPTEGAQEKAGNELLVGLFRSVTLGLPLRVAIGFHPLSGGCCSSLTISCR